MKISLAEKGHTDLLSQVQHLPWWQQLLIGVGLAMLALGAMFLNALGRYNDGEDEDEDGNLLLTVLTWIFGIGAVIVIYHAIFGHR